MSGDGERGPPARGRRARGRSRNSGTRDSAPNSAPHTRCRALRRRSTARRQASTRSHRGGRQLRQADEQRVARRVRLVPGDVVLADAEPEVHRVDVFERRGQPRTWPARKSTSAAATSSRGPAHRRRSSHAGERSGLILPSPRPLPRAIVVLVLVVALFLLFLVVLVVLVFVVVGLEFEGQRCWRHEGSTRTDRS